MTEAPKIAVASANNLVVRHGTQTVLDRATITINEGERIGLVGRNGSGKSTFLRIAAGEPRPDSGDIHGAATSITGYLPQIFDLDEAATVHANILRGAQRVLDLIAEYETAPPESARSGTVARPDQSRRRLEPRAPHQVADHQSARARPGSHRRHAVRR